MPTLSLGAPELRMHQALGLPKPRAEMHPHAVVVARPSYISLYDPDRKIPVVLSWAASRKTAGEEGDAFVPRDLAVASASDYEASGYFRGPLAPTPSYVASVPQAKNNRLGPWSQFEEFYRSQIQDSGKIAYVQTGPILEGEPKTIGSGVSVPSHTYALVVLADDGIDLKSVRPEDIGSSVKVFGLIIPNNDADVKSEDHWSRYLVPVSQIAQRTHHPGFLTGFSEETRKVAWNHHSAVHASGSDYLIDGLVATKKRRTL